MVSLKDFVEGLDFQKAFVYDYSYSHTGSNAYGVCVYLSEFSHIRRHIINILIILRMKLSSSLCFKLYFTGGDYFTGVFP